MDDDGAPGGAAAGVGCAAAAAAGATAAHRRRGFREVGSSSTIEATRIDPFVAAAFRSILLTRRIATKHSPRYDKFVANLKQTLAGNKLKNMHGPAHGFLRACYALGIGPLGSDNNDITLCFPPGPRISLLTPHNTYLLACLMEAAQYMVMDHLAKRVHERSRRRRDCSCCERFLIYIVRV